MGRRVDLHEKLCDVLSPFAEQDARRHVYYQPPPNVRIAYPCIIYSLSDIDTKFADNIPYVHLRRYSLTVIDKDPDSMIVDKVSNLPRCSFDRMYIADNLYHWTFSIYY